MKRIKFLRRLHDIEPVLAKPKTIAIGITLLAILIPIGYVVFVYPYRPIIRYTLAGPLMYSPVAPLLVSVEVENVGQTDVKLVLAFASANCSVSTSPTSNSSTEVILAVSRVFQSPPIYVTVDPHVTSFQITILQPKVEAGFPGSMSDAQTYIVVESAEFQPVVVQSLTYGLTRVYGVYKYVLQLPTLG